MKTLKKAAYVIFFTIVFLGLPQYLGSNWHMLWTWIFPVIVINYLEND